MDARQLGQLQAALVCVSDPASENQQGKLALCDSTQTRSTNVSYCFER